MHLPSLLEVLAQRDPHRRRQATVAHKVVEGVHRVVEQNPIWVQRGRDRRYGADRVRPHDARDQHVQRAQVALCGIDWRILAVADRGQGHHAPIQGRAEGRRQDGDSEVVRDGGSGGWRKLAVARDGARTGAARAPGGVRWHGSAPVRVGSRRLATEPATELGVKVAEPVGYAVLLVIDGGQPPHALYSVRATTAPNQATLTRPGHASATGHASAMLASV